MKTVWILGAGASHSASSEKFPVLLDVVATARRLGLFKGRSANESYQYLDRFIQKKFSRTLHQGAKLNLEEVLTCLQLDMEIDHHPELRLAEHGLISLITDTFNKLHEDSPPYEEYSQLVQFAENRKQDTVITFNWDVLLDDAFGRKVWADKPDTVDGCSFQYLRFIGSFTGFGARTISGIGPPPPHSPQFINQGTYLKLHGSIDWYICQNELCKNNGLIFPIVERGIHYCGSCYEPMGTLIIPPTLNKKVRGMPEVRRLWNRASNEVALANRIIVWGYSLPPTDFYADWLLRNASEIELEELIFINPKCISKSSTKEPSSEFIDRFNCITNKLAESKMKGYRNFQDFLNSEADFMA